MFFGNRYKVESVVEENDIFVTYIATCQILNRKVKLHLLKKKVSTDVLQNLRKRIADIAEISHEKLIRIFDYCINSDECYVVDELVTGASVHDVMSFGGSFSESEVLDYACQLADVLDKLHSKKIYNFGLSSMRVLIDMNKNIRLQCNYFYYVECLEGVVTEETILYCSPEKARGGYVDQLADVYLFGVILYELMAGSPPFAYQESPIAMALQHCQDMPEPLSEKGIEISNSFEKIILNAMEKDATKRESINKINWTLNALINGYKIHEQKNYSVKFLR